MCHALLPALADGQRVDVVPQVPLPELHPGARPSLHHAEPRRVGKGRARKAVGVQQLVHG
eukprot:2128357-Pyramimonas_sp.AAC.2